jgi:hypothetical protein
VARVELVIHSPQAHRLLRYPNLASSTSRRSTPAVAKALSLCSPNTTASTAPSLPPVVGQAEQVAVVAAQAAADHVRHHG